MFLLEMSYRISGGPGMSLLTDLAASCIYRCYNIFLAGMHYIEGGWPGSNPKDVEFFERARKELPAEAWARVVAFGRCTRPLPPTPSGANKRPCAVSLDTPCFPWRDATSINHMALLATSKFPIYCSLGYITFGIRGSVLTLLG